jgi:hypothetical protein
LKEKKKERITLVALGTGQTFFFFSRYVTSVVPVITVNCREKKNMNDNSFANTLKLIL